MARRRGRRARALVPRCGKGVARRLSAALPPSLRSRSWRRASRRQRATQATARVAIHRRRERASIPEMRGSRRRDCPPHRAPRRWPRQRERPASRERRAQASSPSAARAAAIACSISARPAGCGAPSVSRSTAAAPSSRAARSPCPAIPAVLRVLRGPPRSGAGRPASRYSVSASRSWPPPARTRPVAAPPNPGWQGWWRSCRDRPSGDRAPTPRRKRPPPAPGRPGIRRRSPRFVSATATSRRSPTSCISARHSSKRALAASRSPCALP